MSRSIHEKTLHLRAVTSYDHPDVSESDVHEITFGHWIKGEDFPAFYHGDWNVQWITCYDRSGVMGGSVYVTVILRGGPHSGMEKAVLSLSTDIAYGVNFPTSGRRSVHWTAKLTDCDYKLVDVTN